MGTPKVLTGLVVDVSGAPVAGAHVILQPQRAVRPSIRAASADSESRATATSDRYGRFSLSRARSFRPSEAARIWAELGDHVSQPVRLAHGWTSEGPELVIEQGAVLTVRVNWVEDRTPAERARIELGIARVRGRRDESFVFTGLSGRDGEEQFGPVPADWRAVTLVVDHDLGPPVRKFWSPTACGLHRSRTLVVQLQRGVAARGAVKYDDGAPAVGVRVAAREFDADPLPHRITKCDRGGRFRLKGVSGRGQLCLFPPEDPDNIADIVVGPSEHMLSVDMHGRSKGDVDFGVFVVPRPGRIRLRVLDSNQRPAAGVLVGHIHERKELLRELVPTGADGVVDLVCARPEGRAIIAVMSPGAKKVDKPFWFERYLPRSSSVGPALDLILPESKE
jgi:hypothetical protein